MILQTYGFTLVYSDTPSQGGIVSPGISLDCLSYLGFQSGHRTRHGTIGHLLCTCHAAKSGNDML